MLFINFCFSFLNEFLFKLTDFIEGEYLIEQVNANQELAKLWTRLERITLTRSDNGTFVSTCDGIGLINIDKELDAKYSK